jgi:hypothetical protein
MTAPQSASSTLPPIPRYMRNLNRLAERTGLTVDVHVAPYTNDPEVRLWSEWAGTEAQFRATGLFVPSQRFPMGAGILEIPSSTLWVCCLAKGSVDVTGAIARWSIDCGPTLYSVEEKHGVEIITYAEEAIYHGSFEALLGAGVPRKRLPSGKRNAKGNPHTPYWGSRRQPDGTIVYRVQTESGIRRIREAQETEKAAAEARKREQWSEVCQFNAKNETEWRERFIKSFARAVQIPFSYIDDELAKGRFRFSPPDVERLHAALTRGAQELAAVLRTAKVIDTQQAPPDPPRPSHLQLIVDNTRGRQS